MSLARRMGLWSQVMFVIIGCRLAYAALAPAPARMQAPEPACARPVEVRGPNGAIVACGDAAPWCRIEGLEAMDAVAQGGERVPAGMGDGMRLALGLPINVNTASAACLARLPGVSPRLAQAVVDHRRAHGPIASPQDLRRVFGMGPATCRGVESRLQWTPAALPAASVPSSASGLPPAPGKPWSMPGLFAKAHHVKREWLVDVVARLPQGSVSRAWGWLARREHPRLGVAAFKRGFAAAVGINLDDAALQDMGAYPSLEALFVRRLRPGARPIDGDPQAVVSPVDALVGATGLVDNGTLLQIKGRTYSLARLLGDEAEAARFEGGAFATLYLAPRDYHRIHAPVGGQVAQARLIPGSLMPVFEESLNKVDELFARNERIITYLDTPRHGRVAVIKVGATLVGRIKVAYDDTLVGNARSSKNRLVTYKIPKIIAKGGDLGTFELGSTVVVLAERDQMDLTPLKFGQRVFVGGRIGTLKKVGAKKAAPIPGNKPIL